MVALHSVAIEEILSYIVLDRKESKNRRQKEGVSELEKIAFSEIAGKKGFEKTERKNRILQEQKAIDEEVKTQKSKVEVKAKVSYEFFIPVPSLEKYKAVDISYSVEKDKETIEVRVGDGRENASFSLQKPALENAQYVVLFNYDAEKKGYHVNYITEEYASRVDRARDDFTSRIDKSLELLPKSLMGGILGFTYLGSGKMTRRDDLFGDMALMVDVHESIHTPDEYETRRLTDWILLRERPKYRR